MVLTNNQEEEIKINGIEIRIFPVWKWLMAKMAHSS